ncbi:TonB-dependent receptor, partial [Bacteroidota bacterium]
TVTNLTGEFKLENVSIGRQGINVSYMGYSPTKLNNLIVSSGKEVVLIIELKEMVITTEEVVITAKQDKNQASNKMATVSARSFSVEETERFAGSLGDPSRMVANYAGVMMANDSRNDIIIRGNSPSGLLWRLDGIEIPNPNHFGSFGTTGGPVSMLNNNLLTNSDFFTSAFPAEFGNAISGVFDLKMRAGNNQKHEYVGQIGFNGFELGAEGPFSKENKASYLANYRYSTLDVFSKLGLDIGIGEAIPQYQDLTFKMNFPGTKFGNFSLIGMGGLSYIELNDSEKAKADDNSEDSNYDYGGVDLNYGSDMGIIALSNVYFFNKTTRLKTIVSILATRATTYIDSLKFDTIGDLIPNSNYQFYASEGTEVKYSFNTHLKKKFSAKDNASAGIYIDLYKVNYLDSVLDSDSLTTQFRRGLDIKGNVSLLRYYAQWQHNFSDKFTLNSGIYSHYIFLNNEISIEPRLGLKYNLSNNQSLSFGYGLHSMMQPRINYFIQTRLSDGSYIRTNEDVKMTRSNQFVIAYDKLFSEQIRLKTEVYYQSLFNVPVSKEYPEFSTVNSGDDFYSPLLDSLINEGTGTNYGLELTGFDSMLSG